MEHNLIYYKNLEKDSPITPVIDKFMGHFRVVEVMEDRFLLETDNEAPNYKLVLIDPQKPQKEHWQNGYKTRILEL